jgi:hypothetical protein
MIKDKYPSESNRDERQNEGDEEDTACRKQHCK